MRPNHQPSDSLAIVNDNRLGNELQSYGFTHRFNRILVLAINPLLTFMAIMITSLFLSTARLILSQERGIGGLDSNPATLANIVATVPMLVMTFVSFWVCRSRKLDARLSYRFILVGLTLGMIVRVVYLIALGHKTNVIEVLSVTIVAGLAFSIVWAIANIASWSARQALKEQDRARAAETLASQTANVALEKDTEFKRQISDHLHGRIQGTLLVVSEQLRRHPGNPEVALRVATELDRMREHEIRPLAHEISPVLISMSFQAAVRDLAARLTSPETRIFVRCPRDLDDTLVANQCIPKARIVAFQVIQEGVVNSLRWAKASTISIEVEPQAYGLSVSVSDDGVGLTPGWQRGLGSQSIDFWVLAADGYWDMTTRPEGGVILSAFIPYVSSKRSTVSDVIEPQG